MCGSNASMAQHVQIIYDESVVGLLSGNEITGLTFYVSSGFSDVGGLACPIFYQSCLRYFEVCIFLFHCKVAYLTTGIE